MIAIQVIHLRTPDAKLSVFGTMFSSLFILIECVFLVLHQTGKTNKKKNNGIKTNKRNLNKKRKDKDIH